MKPTLEQLELYFLSPEIVWDYEYIIEMVSNWACPILVEEKIIDQDCVQMWNGQPDWVSTLNDFLVYEPEENKMKIFKLIKSKLK